MPGENTISKFTQQFAWEPVVVSGDALRAYRHFIVCGVGGSQLGAMLIKHYGPEPKIILHRDYGLPKLTPEMERDSLIILSSYSGTTEETLDSGKEALARGLNIAALSTGGELIAFAREHKLASIVIPDTGLQPRLATGYSMLAMAKIFGDSALLSRIREAGKSIDVRASQAEGARLAEALWGKVPLIYTSRANGPLGYVWKIKINETSKIPAFANVIPEMCHNEINGLDPVDSTRPLIANMHVVMVEDASDVPRNQKRMRVASDIFKERGIPLSHVALTGKDFAKVFNSYVMSDWVSYALAAHYGVPDEATPLITEFKKRIAL